MSDWLDKKCQACSGFSSKIESHDAIDYLKQLADWQLSTDALSIYRNFEFKNFKQTMFFMNAIAFLCEKEGHHPDVKLGFNYCNVSFTTHELGGLSENDFICASKINQLLI